MNEPVALQIGQPRDMASDATVVAIPEDERVWVPQAERVWFRPLHFNTLQGYWVNLLRVTRAGVLSRHRHPGPVHGYVLRGSWRYLEHDWVARAGMYVFEPPGETHTLVVDEGVDEMITMFQVWGAMIYVDERGAVTAFEDVHHKIEMCRRHYAAVGLGEAYVEQFIPLMVRPMPSSAAPRRQLTLLDSTSIIVGIIVGSGFYSLTPTVAAMVPDYRWLLAVWLAGGLFALVGALCYAELATAYPRLGGDYVYLTRAYGLPMGFVFAWSQLWVVRPGNLGAMAYVFAQYATTLWPLGRLGPELYAVGAIVVLTIVNLLSVVHGKWLQNALTAAKVLGLLAVFGIGLTAAPSAAATASGPVESNIPVALVLVMFIYGGWNDMAYVAAEVRDGRRDIVRALLLGTLSVTAIYVLANVAFVHALSLDGVRQSEAVAVEVAELATGRWAPPAVAALICISALGAINGMIFTGARIYYAVGTEHRLLSALGQWSPRLQTPARALALQGVVAVGLMGVLRWLEPSSAAGTAGAAVEKLVMLTAPLFWGFLALVGVGLVVLRVRDQQRERSFRVPLYPVLPAVFVAGCLAMTWSSLKYAIDHYSAEGIWIALVLSSGVVLGVASRSVRA